MTRSTLIAFAAITLAACNPAPQQASGLRGAESLDQAAGAASPAPPERENKWSYQPLVKVKRCEIGAFTYNGQTFLVATAINDSACALAPVPAAVP